MAKRSKRSGSRLSSEVGIDDSALAAVVGGATATTPQQKQTEDAHQAIAVSAMAAAVTQAEQHAAAHASIPESGHPVLDINHAALDAANLAHAAQQTAAPHAPDHAHAHPQHGPHLPGADHGAPGVNFPPVLGIKLPEGPQVHPHTAAPPADAAPPHAAQPHAGDATGAAPRPVAAVPEHPFVPRFEILVDHAPSPAPAAPHADEAKAHAGSQRPVVSVPEVHPDFTLRPVSPVDHAQPSAPAAPHADEGLAKAHAGPQAPPVKSVPEVHPDFTLRPVPPIDHAQRSATTPSAQAHASEIGAHAGTSPSPIHIGGDKPSGQDLLLHEVGHVVAPRQGSAPSQPIAPTQPSPAPEAHVEKPLAPPSAGPGAAPQPAAENDSDPKAKALDTQAGDGKHEPTPAPHKSTINPDAILNVEFGHENSSGTDLKIGAGEISGGAHTSIGIALSTESNGVGINYQSGASAAGSMHLGPLGAALTGSVGVGSSMQLDFGRGVTLEAGAKAGAVAKITLDSNGLVGGLDGGIGLYATLAQTRSGDLGHGVTGSETAAISAVVGMTGSIGGELTLRNAGYDAGGEVGAAMKAAQTAGIEVGGNKFAESLGVYSPGSLAASSSGNIGYSDGKLQINLSIATSVGIFGVSVGGKADINLDPVISFAAHDVKNFFANDAKQFVEDLGDKFESAFSWIPGVGGHHHPPPPPPPTVTQLTAWHAPIAPSTTPADAQADGLQILHKAGVSFPDIGSNHVVMDANGARQLVNPASMAPETKHALDQAAEAILQGQPRLTTEYLNRNDPELAQFYARDLLKETYETIAKDHLAPAAANLQIAAATYYGDQLVRAASSEHVAQFHVDQANALVQLDQEHLAKANDLDKPYYQQQLNEHRLDATKAMVELKIFQGTWSMPEIGRDQAVAQAEAIAPRLATDGWKYAPSLYAYGDASERAEAAAAAKPYIEAAELVVKAGVHPPIVEGQRLSGVDLIECAYATIHNEGLTGAAAQRQIDAAVYLGEQEFLKTYSNSVPNSVQIAEYRATEMRQCLAHEQVRLTDAPPAERDALTAAIAKQQLGLMTAQAVYDGLTQGWHSPQTGDERPYNETFLSQFQEVGGPKTGFELRPGNVWDNSEWQTRDAGREMAARRALSDESLPEPPPSNAPIAQHIQYAKDVLRATFADIERNPNHSGPEATQRINAALYLGQASIIDTPHAGSSAEIAALLANQAQDVLQFHQLVAATASPADRAALEPQLAADISRCTLLSSDVTLLDPSNKRVGDTLQTALQHATDGYSDAWAKALALPHEPQLSTFHDYGRQTTGGHGAEVTIAGAGGFADWASYGLKVMDLAYAKLASSDADIRETCATHLMNAAHEHAMNALTHRCNPPPTAEQLAQFNELLAMQKLQHDQLELAGTHPDHRDAISEIIKHDIAAANEAKLIVQAGQDTNDLHRWATSKAASAIDPGSSTYAHDTLKLAYAQVEAAGSATPEEYREARQALLSDPANVRPLRTPRAAMAEADNAYVNHEESTGFQPEDKLVGAIDNAWLSMLPQPKPPAAGDVAGAVDYATKLVDLAHAKIESGHLSAAYPLWNDAFIADGLLTAARRVGEQAVMNAHPTAEQLDQFHNGMALHEAAISGTLPQTADRLLQTTESRAEDAYRTHLVETRNAEIQGLLHDHANGPTRQDMYRAIGNDGNSQVALAFAAPDQRAAIVQQQQANWLDVLPRVPAPPAGDLAAATQYACKLVDLVHATLATTDFAAMGMASMAPGAKDGMLAAARYYGEQAVMATHPTAEQLAHFNDRFNAELTQQQQKDDAAAHGYAHELAAFRAEQAREISAQEQRLLVLAEPESRAQHEASVREAKADLNKAVIDYYLTDSRWQPAAANTASALAAARAALTGVDPDAPGSDAATLAACRLAVKGQPTPHEPAPGDIAGAEKYARDLVELAYASAEKQGLSGHDSEFLVKSAMLLGDAAVKATHPGALELAQHGVDQAYQAVQHAEQKAESLGRSPEVEAMLKSSQSYLLSKLDAVYAVDTRVTGTVASLRALQARVPAAGEAEINTAEKHVAEVKATVAHELMIEGVHRDVVAERARQEAEHQQEIERARQQAEQARQQAEHQHEIGQNIGRRLKSWYVG